MAVVLLANAVDAGAAFVVVVVFYFVVVVVVEYLGGESILHFQHLQQYKSNVL